MSKCRFVWLLLPPLLISGCAHRGGRGDQERNQVISERYIHEYGYDLSRSEWESSEYSGKVVTKRRDGVTVVKSYGGGRLHGETLYTYPYSQIAHFVHDYQHGTLTQSKVYNSRGVLQKETLYLSPVHIKQTVWYASGTPMSEEEYQDDQPVEGKYYNTLNELISSVSQGSGIRIVRDQYEQVMMQETLEDGELVKRQTFHEHGVPHIVVTFSRGNFHGERKVFARSGEPIAVESYDQGLLHGPSSYYRNGTLYLQIHYDHGVKHGPELHFVEGNTQVENISWVCGKKHGPSVLCIDGVPKKQWYYHDLPVTEGKYEALRVRAATILGSSQED